MYMTDKCKIFIYVIHIKILLLCGILIRFNTRVLGFIIIIICIPTYRNSFKYYLKCYSL